MYHRRSPALQHLPPRSGLTQLLGRTSPGHASTAASGYAASKLVALVVESRSCGGFSTVGAGVRAGLS